MLTLATTLPPEKVERWGIFEISMNGPKAGNPFIDVELSSQFKCNDQIIEANGFYDGNGIYRIRFMPDTLGTWSYVTKSNCPDLNEKSGEFICIEPSPENHGPIRVHKTYHFTYADETPYHQIGTTCYVWNHQGDELEEQTLATLKTASFNKIRMCVFPKHYAYNKNEPPYHPFERNDEDGWDFTRFNPQFFRHLEQRVEDLMKLGIEADIILFHPYDRWGYAAMDAETDDRYLRYVVARLAAYRNVWWSMANEYDLMKSKTMPDWDRFFQIVQESDPYQHMRSVHNCRGFYDYSKAWVTHQSIQSSELHRVREWREQHKKPVVIDECRYEGNVPQGWGNISAKEMVHRFWLGTMGGGYVGHGETYQHPEDILWWSKGGVLHGESPERIAFFKKVIKQAPRFDEMVPEGLSPDIYVLSKPGECYFIYFTNPGTAKLKLEGENLYKIDTIDTWNMTITSLGSTGAGDFSFTAPKEKYLVRLSVYEPGEKIRPEAKVSASPAEGIVPLKVQFSTLGKVESKNSTLRCRWKFGDGIQSSEANPIHIYKKPGFYTATLTVTDESGLSASSYLSIAVDGAIDTPIVRVGFEDGDNPKTELHGEIARGNDGTYDLGDGEPWKWISVGDKPIEDLEGLRSFTIMGWVNPSSSNIGSGGNRIVFNLNYNRSGFDLVCLQDGRLRLSVNEWPDRVDNDSSSGKIAIGQFTFFAVTYDSTKIENNVNWYFGDADTPVEFDRTISYSPGQTGKGSGKLTVGNYNESINHHGLDRQFRGKLRGIKIFGSRIGANGALSLGAIREHQGEK